MNAPHLLPLPVGRVGLPGLLALLMVVGCVVEEPQGEPAPPPVPVTCEEVKALTTRGPSSQGATPPSEAPGGEGASLVRVAVQRVVDGDTIEVQGNQRIRYIGVDTPEVFGRQEPFGKEASQANRRLVGGKGVWLQKDISERDRFGRLLRYVYVDSLFVNAELVREGFAHAASFPPDVRYQDCFRELEREARANRRGLWGRGP